MLSSLLSIFLFACGVSSQTTTPTGCSTPVCVFSNQFLRFGTGAENSVNAQGLFVQPWYFSETSNSWYQLTYSNYPLDTAIGTGYGSSHWSGTTIVDIYSITPSSSTTDYSNFIVASTDSSKTTGYGTIVANRTITVNNNRITFQNIFSLGHTDKFVKIISSVINISPNIIPNVLIWTGTRDDYVGTTDVNTKTRGNLNTGSFVPITAVGQSSYAIMITNTNEGVLFYSETPGVLTSFSSCCSFSNAYNTNPNTLAISTPSPTDGSYAAVLPIGDVIPGRTVGITWYYAAGTISSLSAVAQNVAAAQVADAGIPASPTMNIIPSQTAYYSISSSGIFTTTPFYTYAPTNTSIFTLSKSPLSTFSIVGSLSSSSSSSSTSSPTSTSSTTSTSSPTPTPSSSSTLTLSSTPTPTTTLSMTQTPSPTSTISSSPTSSTSTTMTASPTSSSTASYHIQYIIVPQLPNYTSMPSVIVQHDSQQSTTTAIYVLISTNIIVLVFSCVCCICGLMYLRRRRTLNEPKPVEKLFHIREATIEI